MCGDTDAPHEQHAGLQARCLRRVSHWGEANGMRVGVRKCGIMVGASGESDEDTEECHAHLLENRRRTRGAWATTRGRASLGCGGCGVQRWRTTISPSPSPILPLPSHRERAQGRRRGRRGAAASGACCRRRVAIALAPARGAVGTWDALLGVPRSRAAEHRRSGCLEHPRSRRAPGESLRLLPAGCHGRRGPQARAVGRAICPRGRCGR